MLLTFASSVTYGGKHSSRSQCVSGAEVAQKVRVHDTPSQVLHLLIPHHNYLQGGVGGLSAMAVVICTLCDNKQFKNQEAYEQHARDNKKHKEKARLQVSRAQVVVPSLTTLSQPPATSAGYCKTCKIDCTTAEALRAHYSSGEYRFHPKCLKCGQGFENHASLDEVSPFYCVHFRSFNLINVIF